MKKFIIIIIVIVVAAFFFFKTKKSKENLKIKFTPVKRNEVVEKAIAIGQIVPEQDISVKSKIRGILKKKFVDVGDIVKVDAPLMEVNPDPTPIEFMRAKRQMEIARVAMDNSERDCHRSKKLLDGKWASQQEYDDCKQEFDDVKLRFEMAKENFDLITKGKIEMADQKIDNIIRSPISGTVLEFFVDEGDPIVPLTSSQAGTPLMTVADMTTLIFEGTVDEIDVGKIKEGVSARIIMGALPDEKITGVVERISPKAKRENNSTLFDIEIILSNTNQISLRAGYSATARIIIAKATDVLTVPERLIFYSNDVSYVEISKNKKTGETKIAHVETGLSDGMVTEIKTGLKESDLIVERVKKKE